MAYLHDLMDAFQRDPENEELKNRYFEALKFEFADEAEELPTNPF